jgi:MFS family permease
MVKVDIALRGTERIIQDDQPRWPMLIVLLLGQFMALLDTFIVNVAIPTIGADLHASGAELQLVVAGYTVSYAMLLVTGARLGDRYGRRRMYLTGVTVFTLSSLACGFAPNIVALIIARFAQGAGAAVMIPQIVSVIQIQFSGRSRATALSAYSVVLSAGAVVGMVLGGVLVSANLLDFGWRPAFLVNVPAGFAVIALVRWLVPADEAQGTSQLDLAGLVTAVSAVMLVVLPMVLGHELRWPVWTFSCIAAGIVLVVVFVAIERKAKTGGGDPLLDLTVLRAPGLVPGLLAMACFAAAYGGYLFSLALHLQAGLGDSALRAGLTFAPMSAAFGLVGFFWRRLPERILRGLPPIGLAMCALGYAALSAGAQVGGQGPLLWVVQTWLGAGMGISVSPLLTQSLVHVPPSRASEASGLVTTTMQLGQVVGVATFGTIFLSLAGPLLSHSTSGAIPSTLNGVAGLAALGVVAGIFLVRATRRTGEVA